MNLLLFDKAELYKIHLYLKNVHGDISFTVSGSLSELTICDMKDLLRKNANYAESNRSEVEEITVKK